MRTPWDVLVVGAGPGGYVAAIRAAQLGLRTALVERRHVGGVCLNWGCIPTKALIHGVGLLQSLKAARHFGIEASASVKLEELVRFSRRAADSLSKGVTHLLARHGVTLLNGHARFLSPDLVEVEGPSGREPHPAGSYVIATGARPRRLPALASLGDAVWDSSDALVPSGLPAHLLILGAGPIGVEFAYIYAGLGCKVTLVEMLERVLPGADVEVSGELATALKRLGVEVLPSTTLESASRENDRVVVTLRRGADTLVRTVDRILVAIGVEPVTEDLGLEAAGIPLERGFIKVDPWGYTGVGHVWAIGDVVGPPMLAHKASAQGVVVAERIAGLTPDPVDGLLVPACCYCEPEVAQVGWTSQDLERQGIPYRVGRFPFAANGRAMATASRIGFVKLLFSQEGRLLGAHLVGAHACEMIWGLVVAMRGGLTLRELGSAIYPHPTLSEGIFEAARAAGGGALHG